MKFSLLSLCAAMVVFCSHVAGADEKDDERIEKEKQALIEKSNAPANSLVPDYTSVKLDVRACENHDIAGGMWKMVYFREKPPKKHDKFARLLKHQYLAFYEGNFYTRVKSARNIEDEAKIKKFAKPDKRPGYEQKYILNTDNNKSELILMAGKKAVYRDSCSIVLKPVSVYKPGDMILSGYTLGGNTLLFELYRRWF